MMVDIAGTLLVIVTVAAAVFIMVRHRSQTRKKKSHESLQTRQERAVWAWARVLSCSPGIEGLAGTIRTQLELEVHLPGSEAYRATITWLVDKEALGYVETGKELSVKVDPLATGFIFSSGPWAKFAGQP
jgi:hypothetical protein